MVREKAGKDTETDFAVTVCAERYCKQAFSDNCKNTAWVVFVGRPLTDLRMHVGLGTGAASVDDARPAFQAQTAYMLMLQTLVQI